ncbi:hypothetical protein DIS24_g7956 [Lasiodiplodia hormozganensis]|uniref:Aflatoxin regulatory protein domain-containing protein n=1 Tax=Lasiodiplodia hormozganensis TaxID=869390 RepID=A0AA40CQD2_9PEZI|nr:hypothetical protein DIS24_g7956 [Lasiodiplodia hormozganensis]
MQGWLNMDTDIPDALSMALLEPSALDVGMDDATWDSLTQEASRLIESSADTSPDDALSTNPAISPLLQQQSLGDAERWHSAPDLNRWFVDHHQEPLLTPMPSATSSHHNHPPPPQQQRRQSDAPTASAPPPPKPTCHCLQLAASLLEDLSDKGACSFGGLSGPCSSPAPPLDVLLHFSRRALNRAAAIVACERCASLSEANMLLAMATQYMSTIFERVVKGCIEMQRASSKSGGRRARASRSASPLGEDGGWGSESGSSGGGAAAADHHMWFSSYCIENAGERAAAVQGLASVQLGEYLRMLRTLKARAAGRPGHLVLLSEADQKIKAVRAMMRAGLMLSSSDRPGSNVGQELGSLLDP